MKPWSHLCLLSLVAIAQAATISVPAKQPTIQAAINVAKNGDIVLVSPGTYFENINFLGKSITVRSSKGAKLTIIDGSHAGTVVTFNTNEGDAAVLQGFTVQNGAGDLNGGGIYVNNASPRIMGNIVTNNVSCSGGAGIDLESTSAVVENNTISNNSESDCTGGQGGGVFIAGAGTPWIFNNVIQDNTMNFGGGVALFVTTEAFLRNNIIRRNTANGTPMSQGGGVWIRDSSQALLFQNLIYNNAAAQGSGMYVSISGDDSDPEFLNNTIVGNGSSPQGSAVYAIFSQSASFYNNLMIGAKGTSAVYCDVYEAAPTFGNNDAFSPGGSGLDGSCSSETGQNGNLSANPLFVAAGNFRLQAGSPVIDTGDNYVPALVFYGNADLAGNPRIVDGNCDGTAAVDMGAYEYQRVCPNDVTPAPR